MVVNYIVMQEIGEEHNVERKYMLFILHIMY